MRFRNSNLIRSFRSIAPAILFLLLLVAPSISQAQPQKSNHVSTVQLPAAPPALEPSMVKDAVHAIQIGIAWLESNQQADGSWSNPQFPAISGLAVSAIMRSPDVVVHGNRPESVNRALRYILSN